MKGRIRILLIIAATLLGVARAAAQYYSWGADPASLRWHKIKTGDVSIIYPDSLESTARRTLLYIESVKPYIGYGFRHSAMRIPFVMHPQNLRSNGMVMYLPKRVEILTSPAVGSYSMPWMKQLVAHEYRHAVQYNNLNRGVVRVLSYVLGQQSSTFGLLFLPLWLIEGDAVMSETQMSSFGRGLQPRFTIDYRTHGDIASQRRNLDKWFCGSYREYIPDHYHIGYQIASYAYTKYDRNIWDQVAWYSVRNPYVIATTAVSLKKFYKTSVSKLTRETFGDLHRYWESLPRDNDTATPLPQPVRQRSYTRHDWPLWISDTTVLSLKTDLDTPMRFVVTDTRTGRERHAAFTGSVSTRPDTDGRSVWWTEYRRSLLYGERVNSTLCRMDLGRRRTRTLRTGTNVLYPTVTPDGLAWVEYDTDCRYYIVSGDGDNPKNVRSRVAAEPFTEIHGLACDNLTGRLYYIATDDDGMHIGGLDEQGHPFRLTQGAYITLSDLRARDGKLYFGSIESGKDEIHCIDTADGREYRLTTSQYGSFETGAARNGQLLLTVYDRQGQHLASQPEKKQCIAVTPSRLPRNTVNPPRAKWPVANLDTVRFTPADSAASYSQHRARRYSKALHLFNVHSWAPASYNPFEILEDNMVNINLGATVMSQNLLSDSEMFLTYGWNRTEGSMVQGSWRYYGLGVNLSLNASYGGRQRVYSVGRYNPSTGQIERPDVPDLKKYYSVSAAASLPLLFQSGYHTRYVGLSASWNFSNGLVARVDKLKVGAGDSNISNIQRLGFEQGLHTLQFGVTFQDMVQLAHKDFAPRFGITASAYYALNPDNRRFSDLVVLYARGYLPGAAPHHSLSVAAAYQTALRGLDRDDLMSSLSYTSARLLPRGYTLAQIQNDDYIAGSLNYQLPLCYPDGGIGSVIYFKRLRLNLGFDYATFNYAYVDYLKGSLRKRRQHIFSYGGNIVVDFNLFRQPAAATSSLTLTAFVTRSGKPYISAGLGLPF